MMRKMWLSGGVLMAGLLWGSSPVAAQGPGYPDLSREEELKLAMSAGPLTVSARADVHVMGRRGFEHAARGSNGWACLLVRATGNKGQLSPHCLNSHAVESVLPAFLREAEMQVKGMGAEAIDAELRRQFSSGELALPSGPTFAYMLSEGQRLGSNLGNFRPHFMLYVPYATNASIGGDPAMQQFGFVGPYEDHPLSTVVILMEEFVSPQSVTLPGR
jgi:hypothetical protein